MKYFFYITQEGGFYTFQVDPTGATTQPVQYFGSPSILLREGRQEVSIRFADDQGWPV